MPATSARPTLYFIHATGCPACEMRKRAVGAWWRAHREAVNVVPLDLTRVEWRAKRWEPEMTPTLVVRYPDGRLSERLEGYADDAEFLAWAKRVGIA